MIDCLTVEDKRGQSVDGLGRFKCQNEVMCLKEHMETRCCAFLDPYGILSS